MKNLKIIIAILAISIATTFSTTATEKKPSKITKELRTEIVSILGTKLSVELKTDSTAEISFMINSKDEIVILTVDSEVSELNSIIKNKLNYKKVKVKGIKKGEVYIIPLRINTK